jgi:hypothetical protein
MAADTGYKEARAISEAAREKDWKLPSFGKGLYLGDFQPDLISPQPEMPAEAVEKGERFMAPSYRPTSIRRKSSATA